MEGSGDGYPFTNPLIPPSPAPDPVPPLISAHGIDEGDVNVLLGSVSELPFPTAFKMLLASSMALWAASAPDANTVKSFGLDQVIDGFLEFIAPDPPLPTAVSPVCNNPIYRRALESQRTKGTAMEQLRLFSLEETISYTPAMEQLRLR